MKYTFFYHYNKPLTAKRGIPTITIHYRGKCHFVENLICKVPTKSRVSKRQPRFVMVGKAKEIAIINKVAIIS